MTQIKQLLRPSYGYQEGLTIERRNVNDGYCTENCTWIGNEYQSRNRTNTVAFIGKNQTYRGK